MLPVHEGIRPSQSDLLQLAINEIKNLQAKIQSLESSYQEIKTKFEQSETSNVYLQNRVQYLKDFNGQLFDR